MSAKSTKKPVKKTVKKAETKKPAANPLQEIILGEVMDISTADKFKSDALTTYESASKAKKQGDASVTLEGSSVRRITTPCIQVLMSLAKSCEEAGIIFRVSSPSEHFTKTFNDLGLSNQLTTWSN